METQDAKIDDMQQKQFEAKFTVLISTLEKMKQINKRPNFTVKRISKIRTKSKVSRRKEIIKIRTEIKQQKNRKYFLKLNFVFKLSKLTNFRHTEKKNRTLKLIK